MIKGMDEVIEFIEQQGEEKKELKKEIEKLGEIIVRMGEEIKDLKKLIIKYLHRNFLIPRRHN